jgi:hypothetical protein
VSLVIRARPAMIDDAAMLVPLLRHADQLEMERGMGNAYDALHHSIERSKLCWVFLDDDEPLCVAGLVQPMLLAPQIANPWLIGTEALRRHPKTFLRETKRWVEEWRRHYSLLFNYVDAEYAGAIRWLRWLGFDIFTPEPFGPHRAPFCRFEMRTP